MRFAKEKRMEQGEWRNILTDIIEGNIRKCLVLSEIFCIFASKYKTYGNNDIFYFTIQRLSTLDVLWAFYQSQTKRVKKAFLKRVADEDNLAKETEAMNAYERSLTDEQRSAAYEFVNIVKSRAAEVEQASKEGRQVGRSAKDFLCELRAENV